MESRSRVRRCNRRHAAPGKSRRRAAFAVVGARWGAAADCSNLGSRRDVLEERRMGAHEKRLCGGSGVSFVESEAATALPRTVQKTVTLHDCQATWFALREAESGPDPAVFVVCDFGVVVAASWTVAKHERIVRPPHVYLLPEITGREMRRGLSRDDDAWQPPCTRAAKRVRYRGIAVR